MKEGVGEIYFKGGLYFSDDSVREFKHCIYIHEGRLLEEMLCVGIVQKAESPKQIIYTSGSQPFQHQGPVSWKTIFPQARVEMGMVWG